MVKKINFSIIDFVMIVFFLISFFSPLIHQTLLINIDTIDELLVISLLILFIFKTLKYKKILINKENKKVLLALLTIFIIGLVGNILSNYQISIFGILIDILSWIKFFPLVIILDSIIDERKSIKFLNIITKVFKLTIIYGTIMEFLNLTKQIDLAPFYGRFGIHCFNIFSHPSTTSSYFVLIACYFSKNKNYKIWFVLSLLLSVLTLRYKSILFTIFLISYFLYKKGFINIKQNAILKIGILFLALYVIITVGSVPVKTYFKNIDSPRYVALMSSLKLGYKFFPIGSGFATFGTIASGKYYSNAYYYLNLSNLRGFNQLDYVWVGDGGWATIIGQFGLLGVLLFIFCIYKIIKIYAKNNTSIFLLIIYLLISSTNEVAFNNSYNIYYALLIILMYKEKRFIKNENINS